MIISRTPFRISFAGGGSDLKEFYKEESGAVLSTTIDKYMYIAIHPYFEEGKTFIKYSKTEIVDCIAQIEHPIVREVLNEFKITGIDITSMADILAGTGLGSSSSYTVGLLTALYEYIGKTISKEDVARLACYIEIEKVKSPIGKQDQYAAAFGGLNYIKFNPDETVEVQPVNISSHLMKKLEENLLMFYVGKTRKASDILKLQAQNIKHSRSKRLSIKKMVTLAHFLKTSLSNGRIDEFGYILDECWNLKKEITKQVSYPEIDKYYQMALKNGAHGGKLLGAGGGGFLLFYCEKNDQDRLLKCLRELRCYKFNFETQGPQIIYSGRI